MIGQVEALKEKLECLRKEKESLRFMLEVISRKCNTMEAHLQKRKLEIDLNQLEANKRARTSTEFALTTNKSHSSQFFVRTDSKDSTLVSIATYIWCLKILNV